jgi:FAD/FMN-containing dehydrogenase
VAAHTSHARKATDNILTMVVAPYPVPQAAADIFNAGGADVVTAEGKRLRASEDEHPDLFWALRGGGGNFGVVTSFTFDLVPTGPVVSLGLFLYRPEQGRDMLRFARGVVDELPDEFGMLLAGLNAPPAPFVPEELHFAPVYGLIVVGFGDADEHAALCASIREAVPPLVELVTPMPYTEVQQLLDPSAPWGILAYEKGLYLEELSDAAIDVIVEHQPRKRSPLSLLAMIVAGGAFRRVPEAATSFGGRRTIRYVVTIAGMAPDAELYEQERSWARAFWEALATHSTNAAGYVNFMSEYEEGRVRMAYGAEKYERLARIKAAYDPGNVFRLNANIAPSSD